MSVQAHPRQVAPTAPARPPLQLVAGRRRAARLHLLTYVVGNALFWTLWAALSVAADPWYWWVVVAFVGWTVVLGAHLWRAYRP